jgi:hypothetical protein
VESQNASGSDITYDISSAYMVERYDFHKDMLEGFQTAGDVKYSVYCTQIEQQALEVMKSNILFSSDNQSRSYTLLYFVVLMNNIGSGRYKLVKKTRSRTETSQSSSFLTPASDPSAIANLVMESDSLFSILNGQKQLSTESAVFLRNLMVRKYVS